jgi:enoyl-CoA hydratase/carnithine racemase
MNVLRTCADGVGWIILNRPEAMNAVTVDLSNELRQAIEELGNDPTVNVIVVSGTGGNFCAGGDFDEVSRLRAEGPDALRGLFDAFGAACGAIALVDVPVIAAVEGVAMAGGFELLQAADIVLVRDDVRIADNHVNFGMVPGGGSTARLPGIVGRAQALALLLSGDRLSGTAAVAAGLAYRSFPPAEFDTAVGQFAARLAGRNRDAVTTIKRLVNDGMQLPLGARLAAETDAVVRHISGDAGHHSVSAFQTRGA